MSVSVDAASRSQRKDSVKNIYVKIGIFNLKPFSLTFPDQLFFFNVFFLTFLSCDIPEYGINGVLGGAKAHFNSLPEDIRTVQTCKIRQRGLLYFPSTCTRGRLRHGFGGAAFHL